MRLNLGCGADIRTGYINIDRSPVSASPELFKLGDMQTLDWLTEDGTVNEIVAIDCLEYIPFELILQTLKNWTNKLIKGGILKILVPDCHLVAKSFYLGQFNLNEFSQIIFGTQKENDTRLCVIDTNTLLNILENLGLSIILKRYEGIAIYVEAEK